MKRVPFSILEKQVNDLFDFSITDPNEIEKRCDDIRDLIEKSGWTIDNYIREMMGFPNNFSSDN